MLIWTLTFPDQCLPIVLTYVLYMGEIRTTFYTIVTHQPQMMTGQWLSGFVQVDQQQGFEVEMSSRLDVLCCLRFFINLNIPSL